jgi:hypothetical protein
MGQVLPQLTHSNTKRRRPTFGLLLVSPVRAPHQAYRGGFNISLQLYDEAAFQN